MIALPELVFSDCFILAIGIVIGPMQAAQVGLAMLPSILGGGQDKKIARAIDDANAAQENVVKANEAEKLAYYFDIAQKISSQFLRFADSDIGPAEPISWKAIKSLDTAIANAKATQAQNAVTAAQTKKKGGGIFGALLGGAASLIGMSRAA